MWVLPNTSPLRKRAEVSLGGAHTSCAHVRRQGLRRCERMLESLWRVAPNTLALWRACATDMSKALYRHPRVVLAHVPPLRLLVLAIILLLLVLSLSFDFLVI